MLQQAFLSSRFFEKFPAIGNPWMQAVARLCLGREVDRNELASPVARYDVRSIHARAFGRPDDYFYSATEVLSELQRFVKGLKGAGA